MKHRSTRVFAASLILAMTMGAASAVAAQATGVTDAKTGEAAAEQREDAHGAKTPAKGTDANSKASKDAGASETGEPWEPAWGADVDCTTCHADVETDHKQFGVTPHIEAGLTCVDCHNSEELGTFHGGDAEAKIAYTDEFCLGCHVEGNPHPSWEALAELTQDSEAAKGIDGEPVNPHAPHPEDSTAESLTCAMCHTMHGKSAGVSGCYGCHHSYTLQACADCHDKSKD